ncbi:hypothetical protein Celaphus_00011770 [Cervus elaphus hippelaphus]|uniref:Uncharacterized protein n=1 Tax=Cervus elaphus hippelaphus TaxID=46360 RepID=A0A212DEN6_CEREH|nr:hypothetical protein Celaphus_00011770 [Cervus elaphus hippelaphus]
MSEVKSRKKSGTKGAPAEPGKRSEGGKSPEARGGGGRGWADPRTGRQEEEDLLRVEEQLGSDSKAVEKLEEEQHALLARDEDLTNKLSSYEPKVEECKTHLPTIESAVRSVLRVSQDLIGTEKKMEDLTLQMFNMEDDMLKAVSEIMEMQKTLEGIQYDNSILKMQNDLDVLKGKR